MNKEELIYIINTYTNEAGVRKLKEKLFEIIREINLQYLLGNLQTFPIIVKKEFIDDLFKDKPKIQLKKIASIPKIGLVNGLYATSSGLGGITIIETFPFLSENKLKLELTGQHDPNEGKYECI